MPVDLAAPPPARLPADATGWAARWHAAEIPVLAASAATLEELRALEDDVDAKMLAEAFTHDPLMCLKVLRYAARRSAGRSVTDAETLTAALVMTGIGPFFREFGPQPTAEEWFAGRPEALAGLLGVVERARRAARFALGFAAHRLDHDAAVIHEAALLHDFAEMLLWCHEPALALAIQARQQAEPTLRSAQVQRELLHAELADVQQALMRAWRLPALLVRISDDRHADTPQVRNVLLAMRIARHSARGWGNAALPDDVAELAELLNLGLVPTRRLLEELDADGASAG